MTDVSGRDDSRGDETEYDPFEYVPDRIDQITASGLEQLHDALADRKKQNVGRYRSNSRPASSGASSRRGSSTWT
jgi:hypothetical protein